MLDNLNDSGLSKCDTMFFSRWLPLIWRNLLPHLSSLCRKKEKFSKTLVSDRTLMWLIAEEEVENILVRNVMKETVRLQERHYTGNL